MAGEFQPINYSAPGQAFNPQASIADMFRMQQLLAQQNAAEQQRKQQQDMFNQKQQLISQQQDALTSSIGDYLSSGGENTDALAKVMAVVGPDKSQALVTWAKQVNDQKVAQQNKDAANGAIQTLAEKGYDPQAIATLGSTFPTEYKDLISKAVEGKNIEQRQAIVAPLGEMLSALKAGDKSTFQNLLKEQITAHSDGNPNYSPGDSTLGHLQTAFNSDPNLGSARAMALLAGTLSATPEGQKIIDTLNGVDEQGNKNMLAPADVNLKNAQAAKAYADANKTNLESGKGGLSPDAQKQIDLFAQKAAASNANKNKLQSLYDRYASVLSSGERGGLLGNALGALTSNQLNDLNNEFTLDVKPIQIETLKNAGNRQFTNMDLQVLARDPSTNPMSDSIPARLTFIKALMASQDLAQRINNTQAQWTQLNGSPGPATKSFTINGHVINKGDTFDSFSSQNIPYIDSQGQAYINGKKVDTGAPAPQSKGKKIIPGKAEKF